MKKRNVWIVLVCLVSLALILAGCGKGTDSGKEVGKEVQSDGNQQPDNGQTADASKEKTKMQFWNYFPEQVKIDGYLYNFLKSKFNMDVDLIVTSNDTAKEKLNLLIASGDIPDWWKNLTFQEYDKLIKQDVVAEIKQEDIEKYAPKYTAWLKRLLGDDPFQYVRRDGKIYGLPGVWDLGPHGQDVVFREDWLKKVGIDKTPETLEEMEAALTKFRNDDPDGNSKKDTYGITGMASDIRNLFSYIFGAYGVYPGIFTEDNGKIVRGEILPGAKEALTVLNRWYTNQLIDPEFIVNKDNNVQDKFVQNKVGSTGYYWWAFAKDGIFCCNDTYAELHKNNPDVSFAFIPGPKGPDGNYGMVQDNALSGIDLMFGKQLEKDHDKMVKYLQIFEYTSFDLEFKTVSIFGKEGTTFKKTTDGGMEYIPPYDDKKKRWEFGIDGAYGLGWWSDNADEDLAGFGKKDNSLFPVFKQMMSMGAGKSEILGPIEKPIYNDYKERLDKLTLQTFLDMITGKKPVSEFDNYVAEWNKLGGDKVMVEAQQAYDKLIQN